MSYLNMCFLAQLTPSPASWLSPSLLKERANVRKRTWGELENNTTINCSHYLNITQKRRFTSVTSGKQAFDKFSQETYEMCELCN
jgi:hypothetical protein